MSERDLRKYKNPESPDTSSESDLVYERLPAIPFQYLIIIGISGDSDQILIVLYLLFNSNILEL